MLQSSPHSLFTHGRPVGAQPSARPPPFPFGRPRTPPRSPVCLPLPSRAEPSSTSRFLRTDAQRRSRTWARRPASVHSPRWRHRPPASEHTRPLHPSFSRARPIKPLPACGPPAAHARSPHLLRAEPQQTAHPAQPSDALAQRVTPSPSCLAHLPAPGRSSALQSRAQTRQPGPASLAAPRDPPVGLVFLLPFSPLAQRNPPEIPAPHLPFRAPAEIPGLPALNAQPPLSVTSHHHPLRIQP